MHLGRGGAVRRLGPWLGVAGRLSNQERSRQDPANHQAEMKDSCRHRPEPRRTGRGEAAREHGGEGAALPGPAPLA